MRVWIVALSVLAILPGILIGADAALAGPSMTPRAATLTDDATRETEDRIGLDKRKRRDVQRGLARLGFDTKVNGKFDEKTRAGILRWQAARYFPATGYLNTSQHQALLSESASAAQASVSERPARRRASARPQRGSGGPVAAIGGVVGGVVGGVFGRR